MRRALLVLSMLLLGGCGVVRWFEGGKSNVLPPSPLVHFQPTVTVRRLWSIDTGSGTDGAYLTLTLATKGHTLFVSDARGHVGAYEETSGRRLWRDDLKTRISGATGYGAGMVIVGTLKGQVIALDATTGKKLWTAQVSSSVLSPPAATTGMVLVQTIDGRLTALSARDGAVLWVDRHTLPSLMLYASSRPVIDGDRVISGFANGTVYGTGLVNGAPLWRTRIARPHGNDEVRRLVDVDVWPVVDSGVVYAATYEGKAAALRARSGRLLWSTPMSTYRNLALGTRHLFVSDARGDVIALDRDSGQPVWKQTALSGRRISGPAVIGNEVAVGDYAGYVHWLSRSTGAFVARDRVGKSGIRAQPVAGHQGAALVLFVLDQNGRLTALSPSS
ncbi:MAG: outer membrane protein assembly factor BamB [Acidiferrobacteraceae bacterium]